MSQAIFRENADVPAERRSSGLEWVDVGVFASLVGLAIGFGAVWLPLGVIVPSAIVGALCLWRILR